MAKPKVPRKPRPASMRHRVGKLMHASRGIGAENGDGVVFIPRRLMLELDYKPDDYVRFDVNVLDDGTRELVAIVLRRSDA